MTDYTPPPPALESADAVPHFPWRRPASSGATIPGTASRSWLFAAAARRIVHGGLGKVVRLDSLDEPSKVTRLLAIMEDRQGLDCAGFLKELEAAAAHHYSLTLDEVLRSHAASGRKILWPSRRPPPRPSAHPLPAR